MDRTVNHEDMRYKAHGQAIETVHHEDSTRIRNTKQRQMTVKKGRGPDTRQTAMD